MLTPEVQTQVAEYFGEAPANPKACKYLDARLRLLRVQGLLQAVQRQRPALLQHHLVLEDAARRLRRRPWPDRASTTRRGPRSGRRSRAEPGTVQGSRGDRPPVAPPDRRRDDARDDIERAAAGPAAAPLRVHVPPSVPAGRCCCSPRRWAGSRSSTSARSRCCSSRLLVPRPADLGDQPRAHARELPAAPERPGLPDDHAAHRRHRGAGDDHRRRCSRSRSPTTWRASRSPRTREPCCSCSCCCRCGRATSSGSTRGA